MSGDSAARRAPLVLAAVLAAAVAAGCAIGPDGEEPGGGPGGRPAASSDAAAEEFADDATGAVEVAEEYWNARFAATGRRFTPVRDVIPYRAGGEVECAGEPVGRNNAVYCPAGDFIAYDVRWAAAAFQQIGDAFLYFLLGHEYAHAIQIRFGVRYRYTIAQELQADCLAGAYIGDSVRDGRLTLEEGDIEELRAGLVAVADDPDQPWFAEGAHGNAEQRTEAFFAGYRRSVGACDLG